LIKVQSVRNIKVDDFSTAIVNKQTRSQYFTLGRHRTWIWVHLFLKKSWRPFLIVALKTWAQRTAEITYFLHIWGLTSQQSQFFFRKKIHSILGDMPPIPGYALLSPETITFSSFSTEYKTLTCLMK